MSYFKILKSLGIVEDFIQRWERCSGGRLDSGGWLLIGWGEGWGDVSEGFRFTSYRGSISQENFLKAVLSSWIIISILGVETQISTIFIELCCWKIINQDVNTIKGSLISDSSLLAAALLSGRLTSTCWILDKTFLD